MTAPSVAETGYYHKTLDAITGRGSEIHGPFCAHYPRLILFIWVLACGSGVCFLINPLLVYNWLGIVLQSKLSCRTVAVGLPGQRTSDNCERCVMRCSDCKHTQAAPLTRAEMIPPPPSQWLINHVACQEAEWQTAESVHMQNQTFHTGKPLSSILLWIGEQRRRQQANRWLDNISIIFGSKNSSGTRCR